MPTWEITRRIMTRSSYEDFSPSTPYAFSPGVIFNTVEDTPNPNIKQVTTFEGRQAYVPADALTQIA